MKVQNIITAAFVSCAISATATAQDSGPYISLHGGLTSLSDSSNMGALTSDFMTGAGTTIPMGTTLASGTELGWNTDFESGASFGGAIGYQYENGFRGELEFSWSKNNISSHDNVTVGGGAIGTEDAGVLVSGSGNLGVSVADLVADGQGQAKSLAVMGNLYYDFMAGETLSPYIGAGIGYLDSDVEFMPSGVGVADNGDGGFAWQIIAGASYKMSDNMSIFADYRYRQAGDRSIDLDLLPGALDIESKSSTISVGIRFGF